MKKYIITALSVILIMMLVITGSNVFALFSDSETSTGNRADAWSSSFHEGTTKKQFEAGEVFYVDTSTLPGNVVLHQTKYLFATQGGGSSNAVYRYNETTQAWEGVAPVPDGSPTTYVGAGSGIAYPGSGNYLYCLKGNGTSEFYRYDISNNTWSAMTSIPVPVTTGGYLRYAMDSSNTTACLYAFQGGSSAFYRYDIANNSWKAMANIVTYTTGAGACITWDRGSPGYMYATMGGSTNTFLRYDIANNTWSALNPVATTSGTVGAGGSTVYVNNGTPYIYATQGNSTTGFYRYNIGTNAWSTMSVAPGAITTGGSMRWNGGGYLFVLQGASTVFWEYDLITDSWGQTIAPVTYPVSTGGAYTSGNSQYDYAFTGGATNYFLAYDKTANTWALKTSPGNTGAGACLVYVGTGTGYVYAFRGGNQTVFWKYDISGNSWTTLTPTPISVIDGACLVWTGGDYIYATFGKTKNFARYSISGNSWSAMKNKIAPTDDGGSLSWDHNDYIYSVDGRGNNFERYSISGNSWASLANVPGNVGTGGSLAYPYSSYNAANPLYAARGAGTVAFYKYSPASNTWSIMANVPSAVGAGGSLCDGEDGYIHCITGNNSTNHWRYNTTGDTWINANTLTPYPGITGIGSKMSSSVTGYNTSGYMTSEVIDNSGICEGGALTYDGTNIYGTAGDFSTSFRRYSISGNSWTLMMSHEHGAGWGAALCSDKSDYIYAFSGNNTSYFWRYATATDTWKVMADAPGNVWAGGALVYVPGSPAYIYAYQGGTSAFWRYDILSDTWATMSATSSNIGEGAALAYDGTYIYGTLGGESTGFKRYNIAGNTWSDMTNTSEPVGAGGALAYPGAGNYIYALQGDDTSHFYRYDIAGNSWLQMSSTDASVFQGGSLVAGDAGYLYAYRGRDTATFWRYTIISDTWESMADTPAAAYIRLDALVWDRTVPAGTSLSYYIRSSDTPFALSDTSPAWILLTPSDVNSGLSSAVLSGLGYARYVQVKVAFSTSYITITPLLSARTLYFYRWF